ncbi:hypothetical protein ACU635_50760 [[Actinomadura] parvosata]|uniref:hypothetical protein n=1 Tax=[Actinomadura] parvosata TaxID=1955412 RepID=UPI00406BF50F
MPFEWPDQAEARRKEELRAALAEHGRRDGDRWWLPDLHTEEEALHIVEACQALGVPITDKWSPEVQWKLAAKVVELEKRLSELEQESRSRSDYELEMRERGDG